jgi:tetratricopeptide (TPR) repeat protein
VVRQPTDATPPSGRFEIRGTLGSGGAGIVYRVFDRELGREVALKMLRRASGRDLYRFKREFRTLADIVHPNLTALHELHATPDGDWYITMELVEGVSFIDWTRPGEMTGPSRLRSDIHEGILDEDRLRHALVQLADALHALHVAGKLHRDLKPSNVLVTDEGKLMLLDFGLVLALAEGRPEGVAVGTPVYMSPEQASDQPLGPASDWYGVGAMLYEALTGKRPFEGDAEQVMIRKQSERPVTPELAATGRGPTPPRDLAALAMSLLDPRSSSRPAATAILESLGSAPSAIALGNARIAPPQVVGRTLELEVLDAALVEARRAGTAVLVRGKSGIGKSTLVRAFLERHGDAVFAVSGRCFEREAVPFKMLDGVVDALTGAILTLPPVEVARIVPPEIGSLVRMFPVLRRVEQLSELVGVGSVPVDPQELRRRGFRGLATLIGRLAQTRPVVLFVDDAHWGDADSAAFLAQLVHEPQKNVLVLVAHRPEDYLGVVAMLRRPPGGTARLGDLRELEISALDDQAAKSLVTQLAGSPSDGTRRAEIAIAAAGGNPLVLSEMARAKELAAGTKIDDLVRERASKLPLDAQAMLAISSVAARPLSVEIAAHAAGVVAGLEAASQLFVERLATLHQVDGQMILHPAHDYVRTSVLSLLDTESKASFHEAIARAFEAVQGPEKLDSLAVVEHWLAAGHPANAAHHAVDAAQRAEALLAFRRAAELYEIALTFGPWDAAGQRDLLRRKAHALACAGALDEAAEIYGHAAQLLPDVEAIDLERLRVEALLRRGRLDEALPAAELLLAQIGIRIPLGARASRTRLATQWLAAKLRGLDYTEREPSDIPATDLLSIDVLYSIASGLAFADPSLGRVVQGELVRAALDAGEPVRVCLALAQEVCYAASGGSRNRTAVEAVGSRLRSIADEIGRPEVIGFADTAIGIASHMSGRWRDARASLEAGLAALREHGTGVRWEIDIADTYWLATLFYLGDWREMARLTEMLLRDAIERADAVAQNNLRIGRCNFAWLILDRPEAAREHLAIAERSLRDESFRLQDVAVMLAAANIELYAGDPATAFARIDGAWSQLEQIGCLRLQQPRIELALLRARALLALGGTEQRREARVHAELMIKEGAGWGMGLGHLVRASVHAFAGGAEAARAELLAAEEHLISTGMLGYLQIARLRRGILEGGTLGTARTVTAREVLAGLGATNTEAVIRHLLPWPE